MKETNQEHPSQMRRVLAWLLSNKHINTTESPTILGISNNSLPRRILDVMKVFKIEVQYGKEVVQSRMNGEIVVSAYYMLPEDVSAAIKKLKTDPQTVYINLINSVSTLKYAHDPLYDTTQEWINAIKISTSEWEADRCKSVRKHIRPKLHLRTI